jgi:nicotinamide-nucleotide amidase
MNLKHESMNPRQLNSFTKHFTTRRETLAVAESVTAGKLQNLFSTAENATTFFEGGITAYNLLQKTELLGVAFDEAVKTNCVSRRVAEEMALGVCKLFKSNWGIAITGYATPVPELGVTELFAYFAVAYNGNITLSEKIHTSRGSAERVQGDYAEIIIKHMQFYLEAGERRVRAVKEAG